MTSNCEVASTDYEQNFTSHARHLVEEFSQDGILSDDKLTPKIPPFSVSSSGDAMATTITATAATAGGNTLVNHCSNNDKHLISCELHERYDQRFHSETLCCKCRPLVELNRQKNRAANAPQLFPPAMATSNAEVASYNPINHYAAAQNMAGNQAVSAFAQPMASGVMNQNMFGGKRCDFQCSSCQSQQPPSMNSFLNHSNMPSSFGDVPLAPSGELRPASNGLPMKSSSFGSNLMQNAFSAPTGDFSALRNNASSLGMGMGQAGRGFTPAADSFMGMNRSMHQSTFGANNFGPSRFPSPSPAPGQNIFQNRTFQ